MTPSLPRPTQIAAPPATGAAIATTPRKIQPVTLWALLGAVLLVFELYVIGKWVTGPYFTPVPVGPDQPPQWMKTFLDVWQVVGPVAMLAVLWFRLVRPWLRTREFTFDGLFCIALFMLSFWDANSAYFQHWFQYNPYLLNRGSLVNDIPGWMSYGAPGHQIAFPYLMMPPAYVYAFLGLMGLGCWFMRTVRRLRPGISNPGLIAACFVFMGCCDLLMEGFGFIRLGVWTYPGAPFTLFGGDTRARYPLAEMVLTGALFCALACVRFFRNDKGHTVFERGLDQLRMTGARKAGVRALAFIAATQVIMGVTYHLPMSMLVIQSPAWPTDVATTSWLNGGLCGTGTDRACPGPTVAVPRPQSPHLDPSGALVPAAGH